MTLGCVCIGVKDLEMLWVSVCEDRFKRRPSRLVVSGGWPVGYRARAGCSESGRADDQKSKAFLRVRESGNGLLLRPDSSTWCDGRLRSTVLGRKSRSSNGIKVAVVGNCEKILY